MLHDKREMEISICHYRQLLALLAFLFADLFGVREYNFPNNDAEIAYIIKQSRNRCTYIFRQGNIER